MASTLVSPQFSIFTIDEYFEREAQSEFRHEFYHGLVYAMAGGHARHGLVAQNFGIFLGLKLRAKDCLVTNADFQVLTPSDGAVFYPDAAVFCGKDAKALGLRNGSPILILEALSPLTRGFDLGAKRQEYQRIPSLQYLLFVDSQTVSAKLFTRLSDGEWPAEPECHDSLAGTLAFPLWDLSIPLSDLYSATGLES